MTANLHLVTIFFPSESNSSDHEEQKMKMQINYAFKTKKFTPQVLHEKILGDLLSLINSTWDIKETSLFWSMCLWSGLFIIEKNSEKKSFSHWNKAQLFYDFFVLLNRYFRGASSPLIKKANELICYDVEKKKCTWFPTKQQKKGSVCAYILLPQQCRFFYSFCYL